LYSRSSCLSFKVLVGLRNVTVNRDYVLSVTFFFKHVSKILRMGEQFVKVWQLKIYITKDS
jgi:hypothetical protein